MPAHPIRLPDQWPNHVKSGILHAISLASAAMAAAHGWAAGRQSLASQLEQARQEITLLREELDIKDGRWARSRTRRRPHYLPTQRLRILQLRAARGWALERTARVFLLDLHTLQLWVRRVDEHGERDLIQTPEPVNRYPDFVRHLVRQLKRFFPAMGSERIAQILARAGLVLSASTIRRMVREPYKPPPREVVEAATTPRRAVARLLQMVREYPREPVVAAVTTALHYGLYDLERLETMILRRIARDYFIVPED